MLDVLESLYHFNVAGGFTSSTTNPITVHDGLSDSVILLSDVSLAASDIVSCSADVRNLTPADNVRLELIVRNSIDTVVGTFPGSYVDSQAYKRVTIPNITLPANSDDMFLQIRRENGTGTIEVHKGMINRGATAAVFAQPYRGSAYSQYPLFVGHVRMRSRPVEVTSMFEPFGQSPIFQEFNLGRSDFWEMVLTSIRLKAANVRSLAAWANLVGIGGLAAIIDPDHEGPGDDGVRDPTANGEVQGASQTGTLLVTDGWDFSKLILNRGDWCQVLSGKRQLFRATSDVESDVSGNAIIPVWPAIKISPVDNAIVEINTPHLHSKLLTVPEYTTDDVKFADALSLAFQEDY